LIAELETEFGKYKFYKVPTGKAGIKHIAITSRYIPESVIFGEPMSDKDKEDLSKGFEEWCEKVLPDILIEAPDEIPGEDMLKIFMVVISKRTDIFRDLKGSSDA